MKIQLKNKSFELGSFYKLYDYAYDCWTVENSDEIVEMSCFIDQTNDKKVLIDIGCLVGAFSLFFSGDDKIAHAIDGSHEGMLQLLQNICKNPNKKIYPHKILMGDKNELTSYWTKPGDMHALSFKGNDTIAMLTLDYFCQLYEVIPDVIKIDTEGFEVKILQNANYILSTYKPMIFLEGHNNFVYNYGNTVKDIVDLARKYEYRVFDLFNQEISYSEYLTRLKNKEVDSTRTYWK